MREAVLAGLLTLPWLWPLTTGPSTNVLPLLVAWTCLALALPLLAAPGERGARLRRALVLSWVIAAAVSAVIGLLQWFGELPATALASPSDIGIAYGNLRQRNQFATLMSLGLAALLWSATPGRRRVTWPLAFLLAAASAATASRTGLLQAVVLLVLAAAWPGSRRERLLVGGALLAGYGFATAAFPPLLLHWKGIDEPNVLARTVGDLGCSSRTVLWSNVLHLISARPWTGWGWGELDYAHYITLYSGARFCDILDNAHNLPLHIAVELGLPAAAVLVAGVCIFIWRRRPWHEHDAGRQLAWAALALIGLHSLVEYPLWYGPFQLALLLSLLVLGVPRFLRGSAARAAALPLCMLMLAALGVVWWRYDLVSEAYRPPESRRAWMRADPAAAVRGEVLFRDQVRFAELSLLPVTRANAARVHALASEMLHYSPEPMVIEKVIDSALLLGREQEAAQHQLRYKAAFPRRYEDWRARQAPRSAAGAPAGATP